MTKNREKKFDLFSPQFKADPFPTFAALRREAAVYGHRDRQGRTIWYVTRYTDVVEVLKDNDRFIKDVRRLLPERPSSAGHPSVQQLINQNMLFSDPPDHTRLRALVTQAFTPRRVAQMAGRVQEVADQLLDVVAPQGKMDGIAAYAFPLPVVVIADMLGIPAIDREKVADWSAAIISPGSRGLSGRARRRKMRLFVEYLDQLFADRQRDPQDDLISALVIAEEAGERLNQAELSSMVALLLVTGHETTVNLIGNGALALLQHPQQRRLLREKPDLWGAAVEELLRFDGPVETSTTRWVKEDVTFRGRKMRKGDIMRVSLASANRDEDQFSQPDRLDITRADNKHLAFGLGIHYCLGAPLARLEGEIALRTLFARLSRLRLAVPAVECRWRPGVLFRSLERLPLRWEPPAVSH